MMKKMKNIIALATCFLTVAMSGCAAGAQVSNEQAQKETVMQPTATTSVMKNTQQEVETVAETESTIYDTMDLSIFDLPRYDNTKYLQYYWDNHITYNESAMLVRNADGSLDPVKLLFSVDEIISVRSADLTKKYVEDVDYKIENGKLIILEDGNIPVLDYNRMYFEFFWNAKCSVFEV